MTETALSGLTVVEVGQGIPGATCGKALADLGADVIKVEPPEGDPARQAGPFPSGIAHPEKSGQFLYLNANKRGITLGLDTRQGRRVLLQLLRRADMFVTDLPPHRLEEIRLAYRHLKAVNDSLVVTSISPFGQTGPYRDFKGTDLIAWEMGGLGVETPPYTVTDPTKEPPLRAGGYQADYLAGWTGAAGAMVALFYRDRYGAGQLVDVSCMESVANVVRAAFIIYSYDITRIPKNRLKKGLPWIVPTKDGYVSFSISQEHWWEALKTAPGSPEELMDPKFATREGRAQNGQRLEEVLYAWFKRLSRDELYRMMVPLRIPCFPVNSIADVVNSAQYAAREFFVVQDHPVAGRIKQPGAFAKLSESPWSLRTPAPSLGQHNQEVLAELKRPAPEEGPSLPARRRSTPPKDALPLKGIRVLDFGWFYAVPHMAAWLGVLGAEVIHLESAQRLELNRLGFNALADGIPGVNRAAIWNGVNFSKLGVTLNLSTPEGVALMRELVKVSDVVVENFSTGVKDRLGLKYDLLRQLKPDIILVSNSSLGSTGPERDSAGWGPNTVAYAGLPSTTGYLHSGPVGLGGSWPDFPCGVMMVFAVLSALRYRERTGKGQHIDMSMAEAVTAMMPEAVIEYTMNGTQPERMGNRDRRMAPHNTYPCLGDDQWVAITVTSEEEWRVLCAEMDHPEWADDPRFADVAHRRQNEDELDALIAQWTRYQSAYGVMHRLQHVGVPAGPVLDMFGLMTDAHLRARGYVVEIDHPEVGPRAVNGLPVQFSAMPELGYFPAPLLGQHNECVLKRVLDLSDAEYARLVEAKVIY